MAIQFECPSCNMRLRVEDHMAGRRARCKCGESVSIPNGNSLATVSANASVGGNALKTAAPQGKGTPSSLPATAPARLSVTCSACNKTFQLDAKHAGRSMKCPCGQALAAPSPQQAEKLRSGNAAAVATLKTAVAKRSSLLNELTDSDREERGTPVPVSDRNNVSDGEYLRAYVAKSPDFFYENKLQAKPTMPGGLVFILIIQLLSAMGTIGLGVQLLMVPQFGADQSIPADKINAVAVGSILVGSVFFVFLCLMLLRQPWVWWIFTLAWTYYGYLCLVALAMVLLPIELGLLWKAGLTCVFGIGCAVTLWGDEVREYYRVRFDVRYAMAIVGGFVFFFGWPFLIIAARVISVRMSQGA